MMNDSQIASESVPLAEVRRGQIVESRHRGHVIAVDGDGNTIAEIGAPDTVTYLRSSAKPFQILPMILSGAAKRFDFTEQEIAVACGSHSGEFVHERIVQTMLDKIGLEVSALKCGTHEPFDREVARHLRRMGMPPNMLQNNCSGKHTAMLALALHLNASIESYDDAQNPVQLAIKKIVAQFAGGAEDEIVVGVDGCGVPVFGVSLRQMAVMYARLVAPPADFSPDINQAVQRVARAMAKFPEMIGGTNERLDTEIMKAAKGDIVSKVGAEGVYTAGVFPSEKFPRGLGISLKIEDGEDRRARPVVVIDTLRQLGLLAKEGLENLAPYSRFDVRNNRREVVGEIVPNFELTKNVKPTIL